MHAVGKVDELIVRDRQVALWVIELTARVTGESSRLAKIDN
jgi:hypothetical protein